jgi:hypothetical protein
MAMSHYAETGFCLSKQEICAHARRAEMLDGVFYHSKRDEEFQQKYGNIAGFHHVGVALEPTSGCVFPYLGFDSPSAVFSGLHKDVSVVTVKGCAAFQDASGATQNAVEALNAWLQGSEWDLFKYGRLNLSIFPNDAVVTHVGKAFVLQDFSGKPTELGQAFLATEMQQTGTPKQLRGHILNALRPAWEKTGLVVAPSP